MLRSMMAAALAAALLGPSIARASPPPVEDYGKLPVIDEVHLSPSGARYTTIADDGKERSLYVLTTENKPLAVIKLGGEKVVDVSWAGEDYVVIETSATVGLGPEFVLSKAEYRSVIAFNLNTHKSIQVFSKRDQTDSIVVGSFGVAQIKAHWYGYYGGLTLSDKQFNDGERQHANTRDAGGGETIIPDLYRVDLETGSTQKVATGVGDDESWLVAPTGEVVARIEYSSNIGDWQVMTGGFAGRRLESGRDKLSEPSLLGLNRTGDAVLVLRPTVDGSITEEAPLAGGPVKLVEPTQSLDSPIEDSASRRWIGVLTDGDDPAASFFDPTTQARVQGAVKAFPGYRVKVSSWSDDFSKMIAYTDGSDDSGTYWLVDVVKHSAKILGSAYPTVTPKDVGPVRMIDYKAADGLALRGVLTLPPGRPAKDLPVVVMPHGGPWVRDYPRFDYWAQAFASRGYAVFQPNFRGSTGYGFPFYKAGYGEWGRKMQTDVSDGLAELAREGIVNPKRACIIGWSYGGYAALAGVTLQQGLYHCAVSMAGISDMSQMLQYDEDKFGLDSAATRNFWLFLGLKSGSDDLSRISPASMARRSDAPILLIHGTNDTVVPNAQSDAMERALKAAGKPAERLTLQSADHWLLRQEARVAMVKASVAFVQKYNPADLAPTP